MLTGLVVGAAICVSTSGHVEAVAQHLHATVFQRLLRSTRLVACDLLLSTGPMAYWQLFLQYGSQRQDELTFAFACHGHSDGAKTWRKRSSHASHDHLPDFGMSWNLSYICIH